MLDDYGASMNRDLHGLTVPFKHTVINPLPYDRAFSMMQQNESSNRFEDFEIYFFIFVVSLGFGGHKGKNVMHVVVRRCKHKQINHFCMNRM